MHPIAFEIAGFPIHWYGLLMAAGLVAGLWTAARRAARIGLSPDLVQEASFWILIGTLAGARGWYVATYWKEEFAGGPWTEIFNLRSGGLVFYGGLLGASLAVAIFARRRRLPLWNLADALAPSIALGHSFGRGGCLMTGCCYGRPTDVPWRIHFPADHWTKGVGVHPTQIYEMGLNLALFAVLSWRFRHRQFAGQIFGEYLMAYAVLRAVVEVYRGDYAERLLVAGLKPGQWVSVAIFIAGTALWTWRRRAPSEGVPAEPKHG
ncbi:MAG: prolipoprotein diacylglyceryl transferase [Verrucomicrobia bacterium]|nr:prolipoprotein diacylglyceryl transferase [Verrucomicrobiota bacterium]